MRCCERESSKLTSWSLESLAPFWSLSTLVTFDTWTAREPRWAWLPNGSLQTSAACEWGYQEAAE
jgi:hypothetical protein